MSQENVEAVRKSLDGWNRGDFDAWVEGAHPEIEWSSEVARQLEGPETVYRGPVGMRRYWDEWHSLWDVTIDVTDIRDLGETVLAVGITRTRRGERDRPRDASRLCLRVRREPGSEGPGVPGPG